MSWEIFDEARKRCEAMVGEAAPDTDMGQEGRAYITRLAASSLAAALLPHQLGEDGLSYPLPVNGGPNPDYRMHFSPVGWSGHYRLEGDLNGSERVGVGLYCFGENGVPLERGYRAFDSGNVDSDGRFSLTLDRDGSEGGLAIAQDVRLLLIRTLHRDPLAVPARLRLEGAAASGPLASGNADAALAFVATSMMRNVEQYLKWTAVALERPNAIAPAPPHLAESAQGDPDTLYFIGGFDLADGEWLELSMPAPTARYWSIHAYNIWFEHLGVAGGDDRNATIDTDGTIRVATGPSVPEGVANRLDTAGRRRGALICRIVGEGQCPTARVRR